MPRHKVLPLQHVPRGHTFCKENGSFITLAAAPTKNAYNHIITNSIKWVKRNKKNMARHGRLPNTIQAKAGSLVTSTPKATKRSSTCNSNYATMRGRGAQSSCNASNEEYDSNRCRQIRPMRPIPGFSSRQHVSMPHNNAFRKETPQNIIIAGSR